jgi:peroxiredoxin
MALAIGDVAPNHTLPDTAGTPTPLLDGAAPATVVVFTCNHCPYALAWHERLDDVARDYAAQGVRMLYVNANDAVTHPGDSLEAMRERVAAGELAAPYLHDEAQEAASAWEAATTPHVFVLDADGRLAYRGVPDGDHQDPGQRAAWLRAALDDVLAGRPLAEAERQPVGCSIKWRA